jgi:hypothetical protein
MRHSSVRLAGLSLFFATALALASPAAAATAHLRGTVVGFSAGVLTLRQGDATARVGVPAGIRVIGIAPARLADIGPGSYVGAAALPEADGHLRALEVHILPASLRGAGEGHHPMPGTRPGQSMTNGTVGTVSGIAGRQLTIHYKGGEQVLDVAPGTPVVRLDPGTTALLRPGAAVSVDAEDGPGGLTALRVRVRVGEDGAVPPL